MSDAVRDLLGKDAVVVPRFEPGYPYTSAHITIGSKPRLKDKLVKNDSAGHQTSVENGEIR